jgi:asparagine synthase (glutamine-hydrolysing)
MSQINAGACKTFSIGFAEQDFSELQYSRAVAERYRTQHQEITVKPDMLAVLPSLVWEYGEPFGDSSAIPTFYVAQAARKFVTVALTGDGGDEMFGGYDIARASWYGHYYRKFFSTGARRMLERIVFSGNGAGKLRTLLVHASDNPAIRHSYTLGFHAAQKQSLYTPYFAAKLAGHSAEHIFLEHYPRIRDWDIIDQNLFLTLMGRLPNDYLIKMDVASMKVALESRSPFLDTELAAFSQSLDPMLKVKGGAQKYLLKKLAERYLPREVIYRKKRGFSLPLTHWLRGDLAPLVSRLLLEGEIVKLGWFNRAAMENLLREHGTGTKDHTHRIYLLLWLELWWRMFITRTLKPADGLR